MDDVVVDATVTTGAASCGATVTVTVAIADLLPAGSVDCTLKVVLELIIPVVKVLPVARSVVSAASAYHLTVRSGLGLLIVKVVALPGQTDVPAFATTGVAGGTAVTFTTPVAREVEGVFVASTTASA